jgi:hypothetical protein
MTGDASAPCQDDWPIRPAKQELGRLLIEQFYQDSVARYGSNSEQARALSWLLVPVHRIDSIE